MNWNDEDESGSMEPVQMQLFYGAKQNVADTSMESNAMETGCLAENPLN